MPRDVVLHGALLEGTGTQMEKPLGGYGIVLRMHRLPLEEIQLSMTRADKRWLRRSLVASRGSWGSALPWISKVGDRGLVWPLLGGALAARRSTRSAGAAGIAAVVVTSAVTWAIQQAVQRDRPSTLTALVTRGSARRPAASSFPSTHAANAFAFAAAAGTPGSALSWCHWRRRSAWPASGSPTIIPPMSSPAP